jgi:hypothetical protein
MLFAGRGKFLRLLPPGLIMIYECYALPWFDFYAETPGNP